MPQLTDQQVANCAAAGGWTGSDLVTAVAVALAESGGNSDALGDVALQTGTWGPSVGLWQIRSLKAERGKGTVRDQDENLHPTSNARHAHQIWAEAGNSFKPWSTWTNQSYRLYVARAAKVAPTASAEGGGSGADVVEQGPLQAAVDSVKMVARAGAWLTDPANVTRIVLVVVGGVLVVGGAVVLARPAVEQVAATVAGGR